MVNNTAGVRGMVAQLIFETFCLQQGWDAFRPIREDSDCDLLIATRGLAIPPARVQIKRVYLDKRGNQRTIDLVRKNKSAYCPDRITHIAAVEVPTRVIWLIPTGIPWLWNYKLDKPKGRIRLTDRWDLYQQK
jgi:hypothetical protein